MKLSIAAFLLATAEYIRILAIISRWSGGIEPNDMEGTLSRFQSNAPFSEVMRVSFGMRMVWVMFSLSVMLGAMS